MRSPVSPQRSLRDPNLETISLVRKPTPSWSRGGCLGLQVSRCAADEETNAAPPIPVAVADSEPHLVGMSRPTQTNKLRAAMTDR